MPPELLERIVAKAVASANWARCRSITGPSRCSTRNCQELIEIVARRRINCLLSSNLNVLKNIDEVLSAGARELRISVSGFHQDNYGSTHVGVISNGSKKTWSKWRTHAAARAARPRFRSPFTVI